MMRIASEIYRLVAFILKCAASIRYARTLLALVLITGLIAGLCNTALIAVINASLNRAGSSPGILFWSFVGLCIILPVFRSVSQILLVRFTQRAVYELRMQLCRRILLAPTKLLEELGSHRLLATLTEDIPTIAGVFGSLPLLCMHIAIVVGCLVYFGWLSWALLAAVLVVMAFGIITYQLPVLRAVKYFGLMREKGDELFKHLRALTDGTKELKLHRERREAFLSEHVASTTSDLQRYSFAGNAIYSVASAWGQILFFILIGAVIFGLPAIAPVQPQALTGYTLGVLYMITPLEVIMNTLPSLSRAQVSVRKIESLGLSLSAEPAEISSASEMGKILPWDLLELANITHTYQSEQSDESFALGPINLSLYPRDIVFIVGGNGSGKTTLAKLLIGLYPPKTGEIRLNGQPVTDETRDSYRQHFSVVFSDFFLFDSLLGIRDSDLDAKARDYLVRLQLEKKVQIKDGVLSTLDLSQGQRKRLALLTAYLEDRSIYVFDEWAADQDPTFKEVFYYQLLPQLKARGKAVVVISHDDRYYDVADRIIKLDYGKQYNQKEAQFKNTMAIV